MIRREDRAGGRRPLLVTFVGNNRQMLNEIRDSLSHLRKNDFELCNDFSSLQIKAELSQSTPNLPEKSAGNKMTRRDNQHHKTLAEIRDSLRPYQNAATTSNGPSMPIGGCGSSSSNGAGSGMSSMVGGGGGSDSSSTASSSSSHTTGDPDVNQNMVQDITRHGFDVDIAVKALRLSGNQSVDAALRLLYHIVDKINEGRYPPAMSTYQHVNHRPSFIPSSPVASDTTSVRSDSPSLNPHRHLVANGTQPPPPLPPRVPITSTQAINNTPRGQTPPPAAPGLDGSVKSPSVIAQQSLSNQVTSLSVSGQTLNTKGKGVNPPPGGSLLAQSPMFDQTSDIPQGRVKQIIRQIAPLQPFYQLHPKQGHQPQSQQHSQSNGGNGSGGGSSTSASIFSHRGVSPVSPVSNLNSLNSQPPPKIMGNSSSASSTPTPAPSPLLLQNMILNAQGVNATSSSSPSPAPSSSGSPGLQNNSFPQGPPPPYSQAQAQIQAARYAVACQFEQQQQHQHQELSRPSPLNISSESQHQHQHIHTKLVANRAVSATRRPMDSSHQPVIMKSVKSKEVQKPMPQTATTPVIPPPQNVNGNGGGGMAGSVTPGFVSPVSAHSSSLTGQQQHIQQQPPPQQRQHPSALPVAAFSPRSAVSPKREAVNPINNSQSNYHPQQHLLRNGGNFTAEQFAAIAAASTGQPTVITTRIRQSPYHHQQNHHPNIKYGQFQETAMSTPRSDSPVSRATNHSPLSVLSTTSSPSTNSDIPEKLPPPYPGRPMGQHPHMNPPLLPPRIPINTKPPTPPPLNEQDQLHNNSNNNNIPNASPSQFPPSHLPSAFPPVSCSSSSSSPSPSSPGNLGMVNGPSSQVPILGSRNAALAMPPSSTLASLQQNDHTNIVSLPHGIPRPPSSTTNGPSSETEETDTDTSSVSQGHNLGPPKGPTNNQEKHRCMSPLPERKFEAKERDKLRCDTKVRNYSPQAFKFFMEQHVENLLKSHSQRVNRKLQLEKEMAKANLSEEAAQQMRKMLHQKESNYIRLKRAKMDSSMFEKIKTLGVGAFGEVALVSKKDVNTLYAMKTLQKTNVIQRNQVAHVKAERDILAEADNEWVVKLYYSFQDRDNLYFVMDYVPGGDLMGLLIRKEILEEPLARFYIAELVLAIESVHRMGFIHRDIKPDNILIDQDGHIKLTDFGLCTGFRWTHNSKYYQKDGSHARQDSMEVNICQLDEQCRCEILKPLEQRRQREQKRCLAHSLVGTPNYIAPEVLQRDGYTKACDWWSVGVILYEMVIGSPPFYASTPAETQYKVIHWKETLTIRHDANISSNTSDLIFKLLRSAESRLGLNGATEVKQHSFFHDINFEGLRRQPAPYKPIIRSRTDTSNFDPVDPDKLHTNDSESSKKFDSKLENGKHPEHAFYEFTFRRFFDDGGPSSLPSHHDQEGNSPVFV